MRWFRRKARDEVAPLFPHLDDTTPARYAAYWWRPGCTCHWSAGIDADYCDFCKDSTERDDEEFCPDCFSGMESPQHHRACVDPGAGPWPSGRTA